MLALAATSTRAWANGRFPASSMLVARPGDPSRLALRATYGMLLSSDGGDTWDWICERAVGYGGNEDPSILIAGSGAIVVGTFTGTSRSTDGGCHWSHDPSWPTGVVDLASRPSAPDRLYAVTSVYAKAGDGGPLFGSALLVSDDAGAHWTARAPFDPTLLIDSIEVAPSDGARVYASALRPHGQATTAALLVSDDDGAHWKEHPVPYTPEDRGVYIAAVDPKSAARVYLRTSRVDASRVLVSDDSGKTLREIARGGPMQGFALADEGATLYVGGPKDGLLRALASDDRFEKRSPTPVQCLTSIGAALWACAPTRAGYVLGVSTDDGATFAPKLTLAGMRGPLACAAPSALDLCKDDWASLRSLVGSGEPSDAAATQTAQSHPSPATSPKRAACGCAIPTAPSAAPPALTLLFSAILALAGRRRRFLRSGGGLK
jgi:photosystem II stability/assembly factor-like uncharacterized protein